MYHKKMDFWECAKMDEMSLEQKQYLLVAGGFVLVLIAMWLFGCQAVNGV